MTGKRCKSARKSPLPWVALDTVSSSRSIRLQSHASCIDRRTDRPSAILGLYSASLLAYNHTKNQGFVTFAGAFLGVCAGLLWCAQGTVMMVRAVWRPLGLSPSTSADGVASRIPPRARRANTSACSGASSTWAPSSVRASQSETTGTHAPSTTSECGCWPRNPDFWCRNSTANKPVKDGTYVGFLVLMVFGAALATLLVPPQNIVRKDGTRVQRIRHPSIVFVDPPRGQLLWTEFAVLTPPLRCKKKNGAERSLRDHVQRSLHHPPVPLLLGEQLVLHLPAQLLPAIYVQHAHPVVYRAVVLARPDHRRHYLWVVPRLQRADPSQSRHCRLGGPVRHRQRSRECPVSYGSANCFGW